jgi:hypothetical protein
VNRSILRINGGEILQKERADKSHRRTGTALAREPGKELQENRNGTRKRARKGTPGEPEAEPAREPGKELRKRIGNETRKGSETRVARLSAKRLTRESGMNLTKHSGNWLRRMARESSYGEWNDGRVRETRALLVGPGRF